MLATILTVAVLGSSVLATNATRRGPARLGARGVNVGWPYGQEKIRGVNIGGWLVTEPWITASCSSVCVGDADAQPSLYQNTGNDAIVDEWTFCQYQDYNTASSALQNHWSTFYSEADFAQMACEPLFF